MNWKGNMTDYLEDEVAELLKRSKSKKKIGKLIKQLEKEKEMYENLLKILRREYDD